MPRKRSSILCPRCKEAGGFLQKRWVKRTVNIPKAEKIATMSEAWDYAAKVLLRIREMMILFPPYPKIDEHYARDVYNEFNYGQHTFEEIKAFELTHLSTPAKNIKKKKIELTRNVRRTTERRDDEPDNYLKRPPWDTIHIGLPKDSGHISKTSVSMLYAAIVCLILRDTSRDAPISHDHNRETANIIYTMFSLIEDDLRRPRPWGLQLPIFADVEKYGYHGAAALNASPTLKCNKCSDKRKKIFVQMQEKLQDDSSIKFACPNCGGEERIMRRVSTKHLRNMHKRALKKAQDVYTYSPLYKDLKDFYKFTINNNKDDFLRRFQGYEVLARKDILSTSTHYFIGHYDAAKRTKRRWCSITYQQLALVEINDDKYFSQYLPLIDEFVNVCIHGSVDGQQTLLESAFNKLKEIGWPEQYVLDKICADKIYRDKICADKIYGDKICADDHIERIVSSITKPMKKDSNLD